MDKTEVEAKFLIEDPNQVLQVHKLLDTHEVEVKSQRIIEQVDHYLDTPDWKIYGAGWACRWREAPGGRKLGLKSIGCSGLGLLQRRREVEQPAGAFPAKQRGIRIKKGPVANALEDAGDDKLRELFRVHNRRQKIEVVTTKNAIVEMAIDHVTITPASPGRPGQGTSLEFQELELELKEGDCDSLQALADLVKQTFHLLPSRLSKFERGLHTVGLYPPPVAQPSLEIVAKSKAQRRLLRRPLKPSDPAVRLAYRYLLERYEEMRIEEPKAWEGLDAEGVHQMRVATRRIRAALSAFRKLLPDEDRSFFNSEFAWLAKVLGEVRDLDVYLDDYQKYIADFPAEDAKALGRYEQHLVDRRGDARGQLCEALTSPRYEQLIKRFETFLREGAEKALSAPKESTSIRAEALRLIVKRRRRIMNDGRSITSESPDRFLHELRIQGKRLRYLYEFFRPVFGKKLDQEIKVLKKLQDVLGEFQDACVATARLRAYAESVPTWRYKNVRAHLIALGQLVHSQRMKASERRRAFDLVWRQFDGKGRMKTLMAALRKG